MHFLQHHAFFAINGFDKPHNLRQILLHSHFLFLG
jgi:hypothetical protein